LTAKGAQAASSRFGLDQEVLNRIINVFKKHPAVDEVILYGSRAKDTHKRGSDIDLALKGDNLNLRELNTLSLELDDLLLPYTFDLCIVHRIDNPDLLDHIQRVGRTIYEKA
jgi:predicted nucleotidyltransferase